jgi:hypothetical protein
MLDYFWQKYLASELPIWGFSFFMKVIDVPGIITWEGERGRAEFSDCPPLYTGDLDASILRPVKLIFSLLTLFTRRQSFIKYFHFYVPFFNSVAK